MMSAQTFRPIVALLVPALVLWLGASPGTSSAKGSPVPGGQEFEEEASLPIQYLEVVSHDVDATCAMLEELHGVSFGEPVAGLGNARTAALAGGGRIGVRGPLREGEEPVTRPYVLVDDIEAAVEAAQAAGAEFAMTATEIPGEGRFAIYFLGGVQYGLWEL